MVDYSTLEVHPATVKLFSKLYRRLGRLKYGALYRKAFGQPVILTDGETSLVSYYRDGKLDYQAYKAVQQAGNAHKINLVSASESALAELARELLQTGFRPEFILCHGTRNGAEQRFFKASFPGCCIVGTEISDTATQFPDTIQWDFHEVKPEWVGKVDLLYSNSWDHSYDPKKLFAAWGSCISPDGIMAIEHTVGHLPEKRAVLDPFGATVQGLVRVVEENSRLRLHRIFENSDKTKERKFVLFKSPN